MLMIRLQRIGRKNDPSFRMLVLEKTASPKAGTYTDLVGTYNPKTKAFTCDIEKVKGWMDKGAQLSPSLRATFGRQVILTRSATPPHPVIGTRTVPVGEVGLQPMYLVGRDPVDPASRAALEQALTKLAEQSTDKDFAADIKGALELAARYRTQFPVR